VTTDAIAGTSVGALELVRAYGTDQERRGLLPTTLQTSRTQLRAFADWLSPRGLTEATRQDVESFLDKRRTRDGHKIDARTRYHWITNLHAFYVWALSEGHAPADPTAKIIRPKIRRTVPRPIDRGDLDFAIRAARPQMRAMLTLAAFAGLRVQEISGLRREDVIEPNGLIYVSDGKGAQCRILPLHSETLAALHRMPMPERGPVFRRPDGGRFMPQAVGRAINEHLHGLGVDATAHQLRHWFATEVYSITRDLRMAQELLGHAHPSTTAGYVAYSHVDAAAAVSALKVGMNVLPAT
jgi:integrase/recombinase XerC